MLELPDAINLFRVVTGDERDDADPAVLARIVEFCGRLPLAIRIAAARHRAHPSTSPEDLEALLDVESERLRHLDDDERSVAACFQISMDDLPGPVRRTFLLWAPSAPANNLGLAYLEQHDRQRAATQYGQARELFGEVGDAHGGHTAAANLAWLYYDERNFARFLDEMRPVYACYRRENSERNAAITLRGIALQRGAARSTHG